VMVNLFVPYMERSLTPTTPATGLVLMKVAFIG
jgi:hypothetical protein